MRVDLSRVKFKPFIREPGSSVLVPGSNLILTVFPTRCEFRCFGSDKLLHVATFASDEPMTHFEITQDIQRGRVHIACAASRELLRYQIVAKTGQATLTCTKLSFTCLLSVAGKQHTLEKGASFELTMPAATSHFNERVLLHMGCFKKQYVPHMAERFLLREMLPFFFMLGKAYPDREPWNVPTLQEDHPLYALSQAVQSGDKLALHSLFMRLYRVSFRGLFAPIFSQDHHWEELAIGDTDQATFLSVLAKLTCHLFVRFEKGVLKLLPCLPPKCEAGQIQDLQITNALSLSFKWSKSKLFSVHLKASAPCAFALDLTGYSRGYRLRTSLKQLGMRKSETQFELQAGQSLILDRWQT